MKNTASNIREARKAAGRTQEWLAQQLGVSQTAIALWENGTRSPSLDMILKISDLLNVNPSWLAGWEDSILEVKEEIKVLEDLQAKIPSVDVKDRLHELHSKRDAMQTTIHKIDSKHQNKALITVHFNSDEYSEEELEEIKQFAEFIKNKREDKK